MITTRESRRMPWTRCSVVLLSPLLFAVVANSAESPLTLAQAEDHALRTDPSVAQLRANVRSAQETAVAVAQLPDPRLKLGANALPLNSFDLNQEPMTQLQLGLQQSFPAGDTLALRGRQMEESANAWQWRVRHRERLTLRGVREDFLELLYQEEAAAIVDAARMAFEELADVTRDHYGTGRTQQQDVYRAELELSRLDDRATRIAQAIESARARLAMWIGEDAARPLAPVWPQLAAPDDLPQVLAALDEHPWILAIERDIESAQIAVDVAREQYKPDWMLDITYGDRSGQNVDGSARDDFIMAMVTVELPLFRRNRQDRRLAASLSDVEAREASRQEALRQLRRSAELEWAGLVRLAERQDLFETRLLEEASANSEASLSSYRAGVSDFTTLMRARITEYELLLEEARVRVDALLSRVELNYLTGAMQ